MGEPCRRELHLDEFEELIYPDRECLLDLCFYKEQNMETLVSKLRIEKHLIFRVSIKLFAKKMNL